MPKEIEKLPVFVYGTLRRGFGNYYSFLKGTTEKEEPATMKGVMYSTGGFPAVIRGEGIVQGELMYIDKKFYNYTLNRLDMLEGYNPHDEMTSMYFRREVSVVTKTGKQVKAWAYIWNELFIPVKELIKVNNGDWADFAKPFIVHK